MRLITTQSIIALQTLLNGNIYKSDFYHIINPISEKTDCDEAARIQAYQLLMKHYRYKNPPIFCFMKNSLVNFSDTYRAKNMVLLELEVPDYLVNEHLYIRWTEILYSMIRKEWTDELYEEYIWYLDGMGVNGDEVIQVVIPYIEPRWLAKAYKIKKNFLDLYDNQTFLDKISEKVIYKNGAYL